MSRLLPRLARVGAILSLGLAVLMAWAWPRSYRYISGVTQQERTQLSRSEADYRQLHLSLAWGRIHLARSHGRVSTSGGRFVPLIWMNKQQGPSGPWTYAIARHRLVFAGRREVTVTRFLGIEFGRSEPLGNSVSRGWQLSVPCSFVTVLLGIPPAFESVRLWRSARRRWRSRRGLCPGCGYDMRGSPGGTCPECGAEGGGVTRRR